MLAFVFVVLLVVVVVVVVRTLQRQSGTIKSFATYFCYVCVSCREKLYSRYILVFLVYFFFFFFYLFFYLKKKEKLLFFFLLICFFCHFLLKLLFLLFSFLQLVLFGDEAAFVGVVAVGGGSGCELRVTRRRRRPITCLLLCFLLCAAF